jgi:hypothetical protein
VNPETIKLILMAIALIVLLLSSCTASEEPKTALPPDSVLPASDHGYELYSWRLGRDWYHTLVTATRHAKTVEEITAGENVVADSWVRLTLRGLHDLVATLERLPVRTKIQWVGRRALQQRGMRPGLVRLPPRQALSQVQVTCRERDIDIRVEA